MTVLSNQLKEKAIQIVTLSTPRGRLMFVGIASSIIFVAPFAWVAHLSLWQRLGLDWAPSIGLTRAYWLFIHGHPRAAMAFNWLIIPVLIVGGTLLARDMHQIWTRNRKLGYTKTKLS
jgi:hypothetical protein